MIWNKDVRAGLCVGLVAGYGIGALVMTLLRLAT